MTDELKYDPELPFALVRTKADGAEFPLGVVEARTRRLEDANDLAETYQGGWVKVIDTTPKPKIPDDAEFVQWDNSDQSFYAMRYGKTDEWWVTYSGSKEDSFYYLSDLLILMGDAEVTVLVRKEDS